MDWSWLILLMCPLMMLPMIFIMMKGNKAEHSTSEEQQIMKRELEILKAQSKNMSGS